MLTNVRCRRTSHSRDLPNSRHAVAVTIEAVRHFEGADVFGHLVAELALHAHSQWRTVGDRKRRVVHPMSEDRLRMARIDHVDGLVVAHLAGKRPFDRVHAPDHDVARFGTNACCIQHGRERNASPFRDAGPSFHAVVTRYLRALGHGPEVCQAERLGRSTMPSTVRRQSAKLFAAKAR